MWLLDAHLESGKAIFSMIELDPHELGEALGGEPVALFFGVDGKWLLGFRVDNCVPLNSP